jgi:hypothetical protein
MLSKIIINDFDKRLLSFCRNAQFPAVFSEAELVEVGYNCVCKELIINILKRKGIDADIQNS